MALSIDKIAGKKEAKKKVSRNRRTFDIDIGRLFSRINTRRNAAFLQELSILLSSGMDLKSSMDIIVAETEKESDRQLYDRIRNSVVRGSSLSEALEKTDEFTPFDYFNIMIGEETGHISQTLELLNKYYTRRAENRQKFTAAMTYPVLVVFVSFVAVFVMLKYIVPAFSNVYTRMGHDLPAITQFVIRLSHNTGNYALVVMCLAVLLLLLPQFMKRNKKGRIFLHHFLLKIPFMGNFYLLTQLEKLFHSLTILLGSKVNLVQSVNILGRMFTFEPIKAAMVDVEDQLIHGKSFADALKRHPEIFSSRTISMIRVGEEVNKLDFVVRKIEEQLEKRIQSLSQVMTSALEPLLIIFVGIFVGMILISMYLPMFKLSGTIY